jgi:hypothetical protein
MSSSIKNRDVRSISIGSKISILFKDSEIIEEQPALVGIIGIDKTPEDEDSHFPECKIYLIRYGFKLVKMKEYMEIKKGVMTQSRKK